MEMHFMKKSERNSYETPRLEVFGSFRELTRVGQSNPGNDLLPGSSGGLDGGSVYPGGLNGR